jgi:hypothetical protein
MSLRPIAEALSSIVVRFVQKIFALLRPGAASVPLQEPRVSPDVGACCIGLDYVEAGSADLRLHGCAADASRFAVHFSRLGAGRAVIVSDNTAFTTVTPPSRNAEQAIVTVHTTGRALEITEILGNVVADSLVTPAAASGRQPSATQDPDTKAKERALIVTVSCHGTREPDLNNDELDKFDECLVGTDLVAVRDETLRQCIEEAAKKRIHKLSAIFCVLDFCHSGTALDLRYTYDPLRGQWIDSRRDGAVVELLESASHDDGDPRSPLLVALSGCTPAGVTYELGGADNIAYGVFSNAVRMHMPSFASSVLDCFNAARVEVIAGAVGGVRWQFPMLCSSRPFSRSLCFDGQERHFQ